MRKQNDFFKTQIRIPADIYGAIKDAAMDSGRSINAEIIELFLIGLGEKEPPITETKLRKILNEVSSKEPTIKESTLRLLLEQANSINQK